MTTFEHGKAPAWATKTWTMDDDGCCIIQLGDGSFEDDYVIALDDSHLADHLCRALSLAKLAEDWAAATRRVNADPIPTPEAIESKDAARELLMKACAE